MLKRAVFFGIVLCCLAGNYLVSAAIFPNEIQDCVFSALCSTPALVQQTTTFSAYSYLDGGTAKFLFEYIHSGSTAQLIMNPADQRSLLYSQYRDWAGDDYWYRSQSYQVVPIPPAVWLFASGLLGLITVAKRKNRKRGLKASSLSNGVQS